jgi:hypothetical protein
MGLNPCSWTRVKAPDRVSIVAPVLAAQPAIAVVSAMATPRPRTVGSTHNEMSSAQLP